jgi:hypothetical protein
MYVTLQMALHLPYDRRHQPKSAEVKAFKALTNTKTENLVLHF